MQKKANTVEEYVSSKIEEDGKRAAATLRTNQDFQDVMTLIHNVTGYRLSVPENADTSVLERYNGKREVWNQLQQVLCLDSNTMIDIEYKRYKLIEQLNKDT